MQLIQFQLAIPSDKFLAVYKGQAKTISVIARDGRRIEFMADKVRPFLTHEGVYGIFEMKISAENKFLSIKQIV